MYVEQRLTQCEMCCRPLALQYEWAGPRAPSASHDRICLRGFACPGCGHVNPFFTLMDAHGFELKLVAGPDPHVRVHANAARRILAQAAAVQHERHRARTRPVRPWAWLRLDTLAHWTPLVAWYLARP